MKITIEIPDRIAKIMAEKWGDLEKRALESLAVEAYREQAIGAGLVRQILDLPTGYEVDGFLKQKGVPLHYSWEDLEQDAENSRKFRERQLREGK